MKMATLLGMEEMKTTTRPEMAEMKEETREIAEAAAAMVEKQADPPTGPAKQKLSLFLQPALLAE